MEQALTLHWNNEGALPRSATVHVGRLLQLEKYELVRSQMVLIERTGTRKSSRKYSAVQTCSWAKPLENQDACDIKLFSAQSLLAVEIPTKNWTFSCYVKKCELRPKYLQIQVHKVERGWTAWCRARKAPEVGQTQWWLLQQPCMQHTKICA